ncbi:MAG: hypothetical protein H7Y12_05330 [Sphingobacteriaceae bacterium]|nr:hypothetical protein [Cytophagaceae bacterium]
MNAVTNSLRPVLFALVALFALASCGKKTEDAVNPDAGAEIAGTYTVTQSRLTNGSTVNVPAGNSITITLSRVSETQVSLSLRIAQAGQTPQILTPGGNLDLKRSGRAIDLFAPDGSQVATYNDGTLELDFEDGTGLDVTLIGKKQ